VLLVGASVDVADLGPDHVLEGDAGQRHERHGSAQLAERRSDFRADPATADDDHRIRLGRGLPDRVRVLHRPQRVDAGKVRAGHIEPAWRGASREEQLVVGDLAVCGRDPAAGRVDRGRAVTGQELDAGLGVELRRADEHRRLELAAKVLLRELRSLVR
jgi:hypothetical protein